MRIAMINLTLGGMSGGYRAYLQNILPRLARHEDVEAILCASPAGLNVESWFDELANVTFADSGRVRLVRHGSRGRLRRHLVRFRPDVLFVPLARRFAFGGLPVVNMVQGMEPLAYDGSDDPVLERIKNALRRRAGRSAVAHADGLLAVSQFVRGFLVGTWGVPEEKITVAHYAPPARPRTNVRPASVPQEWAGDFLFAAGAIRPARGLVDLIGALAVLRARGPAPPLVIAGHTDRRMAFYRTKLQRMARRSGLQDAVLWAGSLRPEEMDWCYRNCKMLVMTSRVESFGMVAIEAMSAGCVCVAADNPCLPEIFGPAARYYPPKEAAALAAVIGELLSAEKQDLEAMSTAARTRAAEFSWDTCAEKTVRRLALALVPTRRTP